MFEFPLHCIHEGYAQFAKKQTPVVVALFVQPQLPEIKLLSGEQEVHWLWDPPLQVKQLWWHGLHLKAKSVYKLS